MPLDASRNSLVLPLLGLLVEQPSHAYELTSRLRERYEDLPVTRSTVTSLLKALERAGLVASRRPEQRGGRPPRTTYELTDAGVADFRRKIEAGLRDGRVASVDFVMAVAYAAILPADHAVSILEDRADRLDRERAALRERPDGVAEAHMLEVAYWRTIVAAETTWIRTLASRIRSHDIGWPDTQPGGPERTGT
ncbi:DNA-binding transcriptional regulator, PadR family [Thermomonospora echinospora]|uniref:DNA-binding transcriptional regulator, PadR family n=1 Tax=Thermomonospora echinospora TaxID=1992 RepID=A0A1H6CI15_9ACTN|nr:PadR family transcriptional regulator [Thermomonospora echinospora]SEG72558.1 DNA-binding transcriptional regulator, PadR family [Thermomonospora echinospora]